eukprot:g31276.t1
MKQCKIVDNDTSLADMLNAFYARFEQNTIAVATPAPTVPDTPDPSVAASEIRSIFLGVNPRKATGLDGVPSRALRSCVDQLAEVFTDIFILSLLKAKRLVMAHINSSLPTCLDPYSLPTDITKDTISLALHSALEHLDNKDTYIRLLFIDYSSAFNTIIPSRLISKLQDLGLSSALCNWIISFLTHRPQSVRIERKEENMLPVYINGTEFERVESVKFLGVMIANSLSWTCRVDRSVKKAQQRLFVLRRLRKFGMSI